MNDQNKWTTNIRVVVYPIMFSINPVDEVDRVLNQLMKNTSIPRDWNEYLASIQTALASEVSLSTLLRQNHSEEVIRLYLTEFAKKLTQYLKGLNGPKRIDGVDGVSLD